MVLKITTTRFGRDLWIEELSAHLITSVKAFTDLLLAHVVIDAAGGGESYMAKVLPTLHRAILFVLGHVARTTLYLVSHVHALIIRQIVV